MKVTLTILILFLLMEAKAQTGEQLERLVERGDGETRLDEFTGQELEYYKRHPLNLNEAERDALGSLGILTPLQVDQFIRYRQATGQLIDIYELQAIPYFDLATIRGLLIYARIGVGIPLNRNTARSHEILSRTSRILEKSSGYQAGASRRYEGSPYYLLLRYRYRLGNLISAGFLGEKDAGEPFFRKVQKKGFDFYSAHLFVRNWKKLKAFAIGDYTVNLGQGLICWQGMGLGKSAEVMSIKREAPVLAPYRSAGEFYFHRGAGFTVALGRFETTGFFSTRRVSASGSDDSSGVFSGIVSSGYNRLPVEWEKKGVIGLKAAGGNLSYRQRATRVSLNVYWYEFSKALKKRELPYNLYILPRRSDLKMGLDFSSNYKNLHLFGETAVQGLEGKALLVGGLLALDSRMDLSFVYRNLSKRFSSLWGSAFSENALPGNEKGFYLGLAFRPFYGLKIHGYADFFSFPWLKYRVNAPSKGEEYQILISYAPDKRSEIYFRFRYERKEANVVSLLPHINGVRRQGSRVHIDKELTERFRVQSRMEWVSYGSGKLKEQGFLWYGEMGVKVSHSLKGNFRIQVFDSEGFNSRIYAYEQDILYSFSLPANSASGVRYYWNLNWEINKQLDCWIKISRSLFTKPGIGSGFDEIEGRHRTELKLQVAARL